MPSEVVFISWFVVFSFSPLSSAFSNYGESALAPQDPRRIPANPARHFARSGGLFFQSDQRETEYNEAKPQTGLMKT